MPNLQLAVDIAETVETAAQERRPLDVGAIADDLLKAHPEAQATRVEVASTLAEEACFGGLRPPRKMRAASG